MSDPLERFRDIGVEAEAPQPQHIRERAHRIRARRHAVAGGLALVLLVVAGATFFGPAEETNQLAIPTVSPLPSGITELFEDETLRLPAAGDTPSPEAKAQAGQQRTSSPGMAAGSASSTASEWPLRAELGLSSETTSPASPVTLRLKICNGRDSTVTISFPTSQRYDFEVKDSSGELVWVWSDGRGFEEASRSEAVSPGCWIFAEESWNGSDRSGRPVAAGSYQATGIVTHRDPTTSPPRKVCVVTC